MYVIVTNHVNWHRGNLQSDRENTGNLKMKFEWVPCKHQTNILVKATLIYFRKFTYHHAQVCNNDPGRILGCLNSIFFIYGDVVRGSVRFGSSYNRPAGPDICVVVGSVCPDPGEHPSNSSPTSQNSSGFLSFVGFHNVHTPFDFNIIKRDTAITHRCWFWVLIQFYISK